MRKSILKAVLLLLICSVPACAQEDPGQVLKKKFPKLQVDSNKADLAQQRQNLVFQIKQGFYSVLLAQEMVKSIQTPPPAAAAAADVPDLLTPAQAAQTLGVTEADVLASLEAGDLKGKKIGAVWRITRAALDAFLAS